MSAAAANVEPIRASIPETVTLSADVLIDACAMLNAIGGIAAETKRWHKFGNRVWDESERLRLSAFGVLDNDAHPLWEQLAVRANDIEDALLDLGPNQEAETIREAIERLDDLAQTIAASD